LIGPSATLLEHWAIFYGQYCHVWKHRITLVFKQKKLWQIILRTEAKPRTPTATQINVRTLGLPPTGAGWYK
jgi:hypothetical protein